MPPLVVGLGARSCFTLGNFIRREYEASECSCEVGDTVVRGGGYHVTDHTHQETRKAKQEELDAH